MYFPERAISSPCECIFQEGLFPLHVAAAIEHDVRRHTRVTNLLDQGADVNNTAVNVSHIFREYYSYDRELIF